MAPGTDTEEAERILSYMERMDYKGETETAAYFADFIGGDEEEARELLDDLAGEDDAIVKRHPQDGDEPDEYGPQGPGAPTEGQINSQFVYLANEMTEPQPIEWFCDRTGGDQATVAEAIELQLMMGNFEEYEGEAGETQYGPPGFDPGRTSLELQTGPHGDPELGFPDGHTERARSHSVGGCTIVASATSGTIAVFVDDELSFTIDDHVQILSPLSRSFAISDQGHIAFISGEHHENVLNVLTWDGDPVLQRVVDVSRKPSFTPDGRYVAHWRLTDHTVYCFDLESRQKSGEFDTDQVPGTNMGVTGVTYEGQPAFEITNTTGPGEDDVVAYITPTGDRLD